jgi:hypothetical protein
MAEPDNVLTKIHDLLLYSIPQLARMPRDQKFLLGDRIETKMREPISQRVDDIGRRIGGWPKQAGAARSSGEHTRPACGSRRPRRDELPPAPDPGKSSARRRPAGMISGRGPLVSMVRR